MKKKIIIASVLIAIVVVFRLLGLGTYINLDNLIEQRESLLNIVENHFTFASLVYIILYIVAVAFSLPGAAVFSLAGGLLFGLGFGLVYVIISATCGATINFLFARYIIGDSVQKKYGDKLKSFNKEIEKHGKNYLLTLRLIPIFPFFIINVLSGLTTVTLTTFFWTTAIGIIPGSIFYVYAGTTLKQADTVSEILSPQTVIPLVLLGVIAFIPVVIHKFRKSKDEL